MDYVSLNGQLLPYDQARLAPGDAGFLHGAGLFETLRVLGGKVVSLAEHVERMMASARALEMAIALDPMALRPMIEELLAANGLTEARLRITVSRGDVYAATPDDPTPPTTLLITTTPLTPYPLELYEKGMSIVVSAFKQNPQNPLTGHKTTSYFDRLVALRAAQAAGAADGKTAVGEALWFTPHNETVAEGCISNVFIVDAEGVLATPPLTLTTNAGPGKPAGTVRLCLPGVTRQHAMNLAREANILPHERLIPINAILDAQEVFLTNAIMGVMPVTRVEGHNVGEGKPGPITTQLMAAYQNAIERG
jgi:branched-chain amino acid aminotransferase